MASPPPPGPQTPQPPPTYPQYPPQQPYPPQYPPQQPYYGPPGAPPPKKSNTALIIVLVVVVIVVVLAVIAWWAITVMLAPVTNPQAITVTGVSWTINYPGSTAYFGTSPLTTCSACPIHVSFPYQFVYTLSLTNSDSVAHNVTGVSVSGFTFNLVSATPDPTTSSPAHVNPGATLSISMTIQASPFSGSYTLSGTITTN